MFGYLTAYQTQLSKEDRKTYQAYYCGLCRTLRQKYGMKSELILTYDLVFLALLLNGLYEDDELEKDSLCLLKCKKVPIISTNALSYAADMNLMLAYHNYRDQVYDSQSKKAKSAVRLLKRDYEKMAQNYPRQKEAVENYMKGLAAAEKSPELNPDEGANLTGKMLAEVFLPKEDEFTSYLRPLFFNLGKYIYLADAYADIVDDLKNKSYNPYRVLFKELDFDEKVEKHLMFTMADATDQFEMLPLFRHRELLRNILYSGVWIRVSKAKNERKTKG